MLHTGGHWGWSTRVVADKTSTQIFNQVAYANFVVNPEFEPQHGYITSSRLSVIKAYATPTKLDERSSYIYAPELNKWVVLQKVSTKEEINFWIHLVGREMLNHVRVWPLRLRVLIWLLQCTLVKNILFIPR